MIKDIINKIEGTAQNIPNINQIIQFNVYDINKLKNVDYSCFAWTINDGIENNGTITYTISIFYVDRLLSDNSNKLLIWDEGETILKRIIDMLSEEDFGEISQRKYQYFSDEFVDKCAGVWCDFSIGIQVGDCIY